MHFVSSKYKRLVFCTAATLVDLNTLLEAQQGVIVGLMLSSSTVGSIYFIKIDEVRKNRRDVHVF